jgi:metacaspase-1
MPSESYDERVKKVIRSNFNMISSSADHQQSEEAYNTGKFELPNPAGKAGGACTSAFCQALYSSGNGSSWVETLQQMRQVLQGMGYNQIPQLTSSRLIDVQNEMQIVPPGSGRRRALLIGINYTGQEGQLTACHNDVMNIRELLLEVYGFKESEMLILMDDGMHHPPTRRNIEDGMIRLTRYSQPGDVCFLSFSGHGGQVADRDGDVSV